MSWIIIIGLLITIFLFGFFKEMNKDKNELKGIVLNEKFNVIVRKINDFAFNGRGTVTMLDKESFNLYQDGQNQIINFFYGTGHLTITWKYKYFQQEIVHRKQFFDVRSIDQSGQVRVAEQMIREMEEVIAKHKNKVMSNG